MSHSNSTSKETKSGNHTENYKAGSSGSVSNEQDLGQMDAELNVLIEQAEDWIKENQTMAMLGGFGLGVFIGVLLRR